MIRLTDMIPSSAILAPLRASDRDAAVQELVDGLIAAGAVPGALREELIGKLLAREKVHSTGFGRGVAVPHAKHPGLTRLTAAVGLSVQGLEFASLDKQPVYTVILLLSPEGRPDEHLQAMEAIFKNLTKDSFRRALRQAQTPADVRAVLQGADGQTLAG